MLEKISAKTFFDAIGAQFQVSGDGADALPLTVIEVDGATLAVTNDGRSAFSVIFRGPVAPVLPQRIYRFDHEVIGALDLFLVPIGADGGGMCYQVVFG